MPQTTTYTCDKLSGFDGEVLKGAACHKPAKDAINTEITVNITDESGAVSFEASHKFCSVRHLEYNLKYIMRDMGEGAEEEDEIEEEKVPAGVR
jgi:hypothetical protein